MFIKLKGSGSMSGQGVIRVLNVEEPSAPIQYLYTAGSDGTLKKHTLDGTLLWTFVGPGLLSTALVDPVEEVVYTYDGTSSTGGTYYKIDAKTGEMIFSRPRFSAGLHGPVDEPNMALKDGVLFMGPGNEGSTNNFDGFLYARDLETDTTLWSLFPSKDGNHRKITIYDNHIYSLAKGNRFIASANAVRKIGLDGSLIWQATNVDILALSVNSLGAYTATSGLGTVDQRSLSTGEVLNTLTSFDATLVFDTDLNEGGSLLLGTNTGVVLHDATTNTRKWRFPLSVFFRVVAIDANEQCYSGADNGIIRCHAADTGTVLWQSTAHTGNIRDMRVANV